MRLPDLRHPGCSADGGTSLHGALDADSLSPKAKLAQMSPAQHPYLNTPETMASGPFGLQQANAADFAEGLAELEAVGLATQDFTGCSLQEAA